MARLQRRTPPYPLQGRVFLEGSHGTALDDSSDLVLPVLQRKPEVREWRQMPDRRPGTCEARVDGVLMVWRYGLGSIPQRDGMNGSEFDAFGVLRRHSLEQ